MADIEKHPNDTPELRDALRSINAIREDEFGAPESAPPAAATGDAATESTGDDGGSDPALADGQRS